jgi:putative inorganic carbon (hco3(-)) transporter
MSAVKQSNTVSWVNFLVQPAGYILLAFLALACSAAISYWGLNAAFVVLGLLAGIPVVLGVIAYPKFGILVLLISAYLIMWLNRLLLNYPMGTVIDALEMLLVIGFIIKHKYDKQWEFAGSNISVFILIWIAYNFLEVANPAAESKMAWLYTIRTVAMVTFTYYLFVYHIKTVAFIRLILKTWIFLSVIAALYGIFQAYNGYLPFEEKWMAANPHTLGLYFIAGSWRRYSIFADPVAAAYNMVISTLLCVVLLFVVKSVFKKLVLVALIGLFLTATLYAGIRGAFILVPAGLAMLFLLKLNKTTFVVGAVVALLFAVLIRIPTSNPQIRRFQSAFWPSHDASFNVRKTNQKRIQPYIQSHPLGGGLGATGTWGQRFSPGSYLASFPPDSGFVRVAVETGWIGLLLLCALLFVILRKGINNYFLIQNKELKHYCLAMVVIVFALAIGNYPQEALVQFPINIYFYLVVALISITYQLDTEKQKSALIKTTHDDTKP